MLLQSEADDDDDEDLEESDDKQRVIDHREIPNRKIYALDLRVTNKAQEFIEEVKRIQAENAVQVVSLGDITGGVSSSTVEPGTNGTSTNGVSTNGVSTNGVSANGVSTNGVSTNGVSANGVSANGVSANGVQPSHSPNGKTCRIATQPN